MKGVIRIGVAGVVGILIVLGALYVSSNLPEKTLPEEPVSIQKPVTRGSVEITDVNKNGIPDWEDSLEDKIIDLIIVATSTEGVGTSETYIPPTTFTGKFSEAFLQDYLEGKMSGEDFSDPTAFVEGAISSIEQNTLSPKHTRGELTLIPTTPEILREYGNELVSIMTRHSKTTESELAILSRVLETEDEALLAQLKPIEESYTATIADTLGMPVPDMLAREHVELLNAYEAVRLDLEAMQQLYTDPLYALARIRIYESDIQSLSSILKTIGGIIDDNGIIYSREESGSFFYIFDAI